MKPGFWEQFHFTSFTNPSQTLALSPKVFSRNRPMVESPQIRPISAIGSSQNRGLSKNRVPTPLLRPFPTLLPCIAVVDAAAVKSLLDGFEGFAGFRFSGFILDWYFGFRVGKCVSFER
ncbi:hypothetical protein CASFOL_035228 [Castilleja foliolosa]|uniref:Uncharacterized protein n=1 Tax=Castilleja foliolosa TaxID=1961234 RepID=A0ABD3BS22_9LAMI